MAQCCYDEAKLHRSRISLLVKSTITAGKVDYHYDLFCDSYLRLGNSVSAAVASSLIRFLCI